MKLQKPILFYLVLVLVYFGQGFFFGDESSIGKFLLLIIFGYNIYYFFKCLQLKYKPLLLKAVTLFLFLNVFYYLYGDAVLLNVSSDVSFGIIKTILLATTSIYPAYYWGRNGKALEKPYLILCVGYFITIYLSGLEYSTLKEYVNNMGYYYLTFIPFLLLIKGKPFFKILLCLVLNILIINSAKRGAIIACAAIDIIFFIYIFKTKELPQNIFVKVLIVFLLSCTAFYAWQIFLSNEYVLRRFSQLEEGNSSGRDVIYMNILIKYIYEYDWTQQIFGGGFCNAPTLSSRGVFAHNDWLELLADLGVVGVLAYAYIIFGMLKLIQQAKRQNTKYILIMITAIWFMKTLFSMSYLEENSFFLMMLLGYVATKLHSHERKKIKMG